MTGNLMSIVAPTRNRLLWLREMTASVSTAGQSLFRTRAVGQVDGWDEAYSFAQDHDLRLRLARKLRRPRFEFREAFPHATSEPVPRPRLRRR